MLLSLFGLWFLLLLFKPDRVFGHITDNRKYGVQKYDRKTYKQKDTYITGANGTPQKLIPYICNPGNRVCESSWYEQPLSKWNFTCTLCAVHLFGGVDLWNYERQLLLDIAAQRRCTAAFKQTLPLTTPSRTAWLTRAMTRLSFVILDIVYGRRLGWAHQGWRRLRETWQNQSRQEKRWGANQTAKKLPVRLLILDKT